MATASPRGKRPFTPLTPGGSRLRPCSRSALLAPTSTAMLPLRERPATIQRFRLSIRSTFVGKRVPIPSPPVRRTRTSGSRPSPFDLFPRHYVILIDYGHDAQLQQAEEGIARVQVALPVGQVAAREEGLSDGDVVPGEQLLVCLHQGALGHGGQHP